MAGAAQRATMPSARREPRRGPKQRSRASCRTHRGVHNTDNASGWWVWDRDSTATQVSRAVLREAAQLLTTGQHRHHQLYRAKTRKPMVSKRQCRESCQRRSGGVLLRYAGAGRCHPTDDVRAAAVEEFPVYAMGRAMMLDADTGRVYAPSRAPERRPAVGHAQIGSGDDTAWPAAPPPGLTPPLPAGSKH